MGQLDKRKPCEGYFKQTVFGLRYMFKTFSILDRNIGMPVMKHTKPVRQIMNRYEVIQLLKAAQLPKHKIALALAYGSGLRVMEVVNVEVRDIDLIRKTIHIRNGKGGYDRFAPISDDFIRGYTNYVSNHSITKHLFPGRDVGKSLSIGAMQHALVRARTKAGITKKISMHNIRHTYAVHFLEDTGDLLKLKQYLGHHDIRNTMQYLKMAQAVPTTEGYSPLTKVFELARQNNKQ